MGSPKPLRFEESIHALGRLEDPRARSSLTFSLAYVFALMSQLGRLWSSQPNASRHEAFDLEFARPHSDSNLASIYMGLRRFGAAERCLQRVEDASSERGIGIHVLNARILRCRLALQTGELARAHELIRQAPATEATIPSLQAEFLATQALTYAAEGNRRLAAGSRGCCCGTQRGGRNTSNGCGSSSNRRDRRESATGVRGPLRVR